MDLLEQFKANWLRKQYTRGAQPILVAVSGGCDSMVLCDLLLKLKIPFGVAHCNFQLRGLEADLDEQLVKDWASQNSIPFFTTRFDTATIATEAKTGIQETARNLRYAWLETIRSEQGFQKIATAHHANDNVETLLINLFRGTGMSGLHGIPEVNEKIIRPLLFASRNAIRDYASHENVTFREDASNASDKYLRNAIRLNVLPVVEQYFPQVIQQVSDSIFRFSQSELLYRKEVQKQLRKLVEQRGKDFYISVRKLQKMEALEAITYELFRDYGFSPAQISDILRLTDAETGRYVTSPTHKVIRNRDFLIITATEAQQAEFFSIDELPCDISMEGHSFKFTLINRPEVLNPDPAVALIDASKLTMPLVLRKWRMGDYFYPLGMGMKKKKIGRFFIDQKVPLHEKDKVWVLETDKKIIWVAGMRLDERFKVRPGTERLLKVELRVQ